jgi:vitamin B12/bleomycin/antimicrobial peptide transport system ATP-binding/permease protein
MKRIGSFLGDVWALARPYWNSEERWIARGLLAAVVALNLALVGMSVLLTFWQRAFYNALERRDWDAFVGLLFLGRSSAEDGWLPGFCVVAAIFILVAVYALYLRQALQLRWRRWITTRTLERWLGHRAYYRMALMDSETDNPDQRIAEDIKLFVDDTLALGLGLMSSVVTLLSFIIVLWNLSADVPVAGVEVPGYLVWVALLYAALGTWLAHLIGRRLVGLNFLQQRVEADFRYALVRVRDNVEGIALHGGEPDEKRGLSTRFGALAENWWAIMVATKRLTFFTAGYGQVASIFPIVVAAPAYFSGAIPLGGLIQTSSAFGQVQGALSWIVDNYARLTEWRATVERLTGFTAAIAAAEAAQGLGPASRTSADGALRARNLHLALPDGRMLLDGANLDAQPGEAVLLTGASGSGKSTLFRAIAGIWPYGSGHTERPDGALFLPQRPYIPLGSLRRAIAYPADATQFSDAQLTDALHAARLPNLTIRLDDVDNWDRRLSGGEQQRLAIARALLLKPQALFLDEATASLDPDAERQLYETLRQHLPHTLIMSIAHRPAVAAFHDRTLRLAERNLSPATG